MDNSTMLFLLTTLPKMQTRRDCLSKRSQVNDQCVAPYKTEYLLYVMYARICDPICCYLSLFDDRLSISYSLNTAKSQIVHRLLDKELQWILFLKIRFLTKKILADHLRCGVQFVMPCIFVTAMFTVNSSRFQCSDEIMSVKLDSRLAVVLSSPPVWEI